MPTTRPTPQSDQAGQADREVYAGVDTHAGTHHAAVVDSLGRHLGDHEFITSAAGIAALYAFICSFGTLIRVGVEGTASYGATLTTYLRDQSVTVCEVIHPSRATRRLGKSDPIDAYNAAVTAAGNDDLPVPKLLGGVVDGIRTLLKTRVTAVKARSAAVTQVRSLLVTAPQNIRQAYEHPSPIKLLDRLDTIDEQTDQLELIALGNLARRVHALDKEIDASTATLTRLVTQVAPALLAASGVGTVTAAQLLVTAGENPERIRNKSKFAALCGVCPIPASSGKTQRMRLNRGGDRDANCALHQIAVVRMAHDQRTKDYAAKRLAEGKSKMEILRCLKRYIANEIYGLIVHPPQVADVEDLRPLRKQRGLSLQTVAGVLGVHPNKVSRIERGGAHDAGFVTRYRAYLEDLEG